MSSADLLSATSPASSVRHPCVVSPGPSLPWLRRRRFCDARCSFYTIDPMTRDPIYYGQVQRPHIYRPRAPASYRSTVSYSGEYEPGTVVVSTRERRLYYVLGDGKAVRYAVGVGRQGSMVRHRDHHHETHVAGLASAQGDAASPPRPAPLHVRRCQQPSRRSGPVSRHLGVPHPRLQRAMDHGPGRFLRLHSHDQRRRHDLKRVSVGTKVVILR